MTETVVDIADIGISAAPLSSEAVALLEGFRKIPAPVFAVVDGAKFGRLPTLLNDLDLQHRSLFLEHGDADVEAAGGWLVPINNEEEMTKLLGLPGAATSLVLWSCPDGEASLHRHLRSINLVIIPDDEEGEATELGSEAKPDEKVVPAAPREQTVMFRHCDPNVIASLLPLFDEGQFARFFGPAIYLSWYSTDFGGRRRAARPEDLPLAPRGLLRIRADQIHEFEQVRLKGSQAKIAAFLRQSAPRQAEALGDHQLGSFIHKSNHSGEALGLRSERALGYWAFLQLTSEGRIGRDPATQDMLRNDPQMGTPDDKIFMLMRRLATVPDNL